jgi:hypothetical protein
VKSMQRTNSRARNGSTLLLALAVASVLGACALNAPPALSTLSVAVADSASFPFAEVDAQATAALEASERKPDDVALAIQAASLLFQAADARVQHAAVSVCAEGDSVELVLTADDRVAAEVRTQVASLCTDGLAAAERVLARESSNAAAQLQRGLCLSLLAWANGAARSLVQGYGPRIVEAIDRAVAGDALGSDCAALRLQGRFRSKAPWPFRDRVLARSALERAAKDAPCVVNLLFLGDALWLEGDRVNAVAKWRDVANARGSESSPHSDDALRQLAARRIAAAAREGAGS